MSDISFKIKLGALYSSGSFYDSSKEELRVLLCLIAEGGKVSSEEELARSACVSLARAKSSLALWEESGVIALDSYDDSEDSFAEVIDEFEDSEPDYSSFDEEESKEVAREIRDRGLAELIEECAALMCRPGLSTQEIKNITALHTQLALSAEYILTLAAHLSDKGKLAPKRLYNEAQKLIDKGIDNLEMLEQYINDKEKETGAEWEVRHVLGIYQRNLSKTEREYFNRWVNEYGYSTPIIEEAYNINIAQIDRRSVSYIDKLLRSWHEAGLSTVSECRAYYEQNKALLAAERGAERAAKRQKKTTPESETPKYSEFDSEDALMKALERSYGEEK